MKKSKYLRNLTPAQRQAVKHGKGPALVVAGPGSGKTRVITHRIAYLLAKGVDPSTIVAVTFTNKAANEMKERVTTLVGRGKTRGLTCSTFHSFCWKLIQRWSHAGALNTELAYYSICAEDDVKSIIEAEILKYFDLSDRKEKTKLSQAAGAVNPNLLDVNWVRREISSIKQKLLTPKEWLRQVKGEERYGVEGPDSRYAKEKKDLYQLYRAYRKQLLKQRLLDFDDLLFIIGRSLRDDDSFRERVASGIEYLLVDEYQDTNAAQFEICENLVDGKNNIFVVGDLDQSVYAFRGADFTNLQRYQESFSKSGIKTYTLETNFRSIKPITDVANSLIAYNKDRIEKEIVPVKLKGKIPTLHLFSSMDQEAATFANIIKSDLLRSKLSPKDIALLYRTKVQSRRLEEQCIRLNIPYRIVGSLSFYERKIIKDVLAYAKLLYNQKDDTSCGRILNYPTRGLGKAALATLDAVSTEAGCSRLEVFKYRLYEDSPLVKGAQLDRFRQFRYVFRDLIKSKSGNAFEAINAIVLVTGLERKLTTTEGKSKKAAEDDLKRWDHIVELLKAAEDFVSGSDSAATLKDYLDWISLVQSQEDKEEDNRVTLMTCHAAKGLEFKKVFICGASNLNMPHYRSAFVKEPWSSPTGKLDQVKRKSKGKLVKGLEEERRLFYVAVTRAEEELHIGSPIVISRGNQELVVGPSIFCFETWNDLQRTNYGTNWDFSEKDRFHEAWKAAYLDYMGPFRGIEAYNEMSSSTMESHSEVEVNDREEGKGSAGNILEKNGGPKSSKQTRGGRAFTLFD
jgi:DNA helicase-2/ATP-dependent DNA helicase PcrA